MINNNEYIIAAAIHYDDGEVYNFQATYGVETGFVIGGFRHPLIIQVASTNPFWDDEEYHLIRFKKNKEYKTFEGFLTSHGRFVGREEAGKIAFSASQIDKPIKILHSEDVFPCQRYYASSRKNPSIKEININLNDYK